MASRVSTATPQVRLGDPRSHGGTIVTGAQRTLVDGKPAARMGDLAGCGAVIVTGSDTTLVE